MRSGRRDWRSASGEDGDDNAGVPILLFRIFGPRVPGANGPSCPTGAPRASQLPVTVIARDRPTLPRVASWATTVIDETPRSAERFPPGCVTFWTVVWADDHCSRTAARAAPTMPAWLRSAAGTT